MKISLHKIAVLIMGLAMAFQFAAAEGHSHKKKCNKEQPECGNPNNDDGRGGKKDNQ